MPHAVASMTTSLTGCAVDRVGFLEPDADLLGGGGGQVLADVVGADGQFPVAAVDQHGEADDARAAEVDDGVQGGADGAAGVEDVVDQHHDLVVDAGARQLGGVRRAGGLVREVVAEHGDVELADDRGGVHGGIGGGDLGGEADGEGVAPARDAQQDEVLGALVGLENFMGDTSKRAVDVSLVEDNPGEHNLRRTRC